MGRDWLSLEQFRQVMKKGSKKKSPDEILEEKREQSRKLKSYRRRNAPNP